MSKIAHNRSPVQMYQIDFNAVAAGRHIAMSKRRIRWRFGFPNKEALEAGETGTACRGTEHDVTVIWSVTSGKKVIIADSQHIHMSMDRSGVFDHSFNLRGNHVARVCIHANPPTTNGTRQYELFIDGRSFFTLPKVFELGVSGSSEKRVPGVITQSQRNVLSQRSTSDGLSYDRKKGGYVEAVVAPKSKGEEDEDLRRAIAASLEESKKHLVSKGRHVEDSKPTSIITNPTQFEAPSSEKVASPAPVADLLDFSDPAPAPSPGAMVPVGVPQTQWTQTFTATPEPVPAALPQVDPFTSAPEVAPQLPQASATPNDPFSPRAPTYNDISNNILNSYPGAPQTTDDGSAMGGGISVSTMPARTNNNPFDTNRSYGGGYEQPMGGSARPTTAQTTNPVMNAPPPQYNYATSPSNQYQANNTNYGQQQQYGAAGRPPMPTQYQQQQQQQQSYGVPPTGQTPGYGNYQY